MKEKLLKHFQKEYEVSMGHPTDSNGPATHMIYYVVGKKDGTNSRGRGKDDTTWATRVLNEIGEEYSTEAFMLVLQTSNEFIETFGQRLGINFK